MEGISLFFSILSSLVAAVAAYFSFPQFRKMQPVITAFVSDIPNCDRRGSKAEQLQQDGYFLLNISISRIDSPIDFRRITVDDAMVPARVVDEIGEYVRSGSTGMARRSVAFRRRVLKNESFSILIRPLPPKSESGILTVSLRYGLFLRASAKCKYSRTHFY